VTEPLPPNVTARSLCGSMRPCPVLFATCTAEKVSGRRPKRLLSLTRTEPSAGSDMRTMCRTLWSVKVTGAGVGAVGSAVVASDIAPVQEA
jgi:hypothetical protein